MNLSILKRPQGVVKESLAVYDKFVAATLSVWAILLNGGFVGDCMFPSATMVFLMLEV